MLLIKDFFVSRDDVFIIKNISMSFQLGTLHLLLGKNGAGKSTLALALMGHPAYKASGSAYLHGTDLLSIPVHERSKHGLFLSFQHPQEIPGVQALTFLYEMCRSHGQLYDSIEQFHAHVCVYMKLLKLDESLLYRELNHGFSGGEKKRFELLQLLLLKPKIAILDEPDSGLDVDAIKSLYDGIQYIRKEIPEMIMIIITHYQQLLDRITPDYVHVLDQGTIVNSGNFQIAEAIFKRGYHEIGQ